MRTVLGERGRSVNSTARPATVQPLRHGIRSHSHGRLRADLVL